MATRQREVAPVMIEGGILPIGRRMAGGAIGAVPAIVLIILFMTGVTISGCALINTIPMTGFAFCFGMLALQFKGCEIVVEFGGCPGTGGMTGGTIRPKTSIMRFIGTVAGVAILRRSLEIGKCSCIEMTFRADHFDVATSQSEGKIVLEVLTQSVHAIVTIETGIAIGKGMCQGEGRVHLTVAGLAGG